MAAGFLFRFAMAMALGQLWLEGDISEMRLPSLVAFVTFLLHFVYLPVKRCGGAVQIPIFAANFARNEKNFFEFFVVDGLRGCGIFADGARGDYEESGIGCRKILCL